MEGPLTYSRKAKPNHRAVNDSKDPVFNLDDKFSEPCVAAYPETYEESKNIQIGEGSSIPELSFLCSPGGVPHRQRSKTRAICRKTTAVDSGDLTVQELPGPLIRTTNAHRKRKSRKVAEVSSDPEQTLATFRCRGQPKRRLKSSNTQQQGKLDDNIFNKYLGNLWRSYANDRKESFTYLDCLWFTMYTRESANESSRAKVLSWIKRKNIFSKKYVFLPICKWSHWTLLIFCHLGEDLQSKMKTPCMLLLDSLQNADPKRLEPEIRKFLFDIYKAEERPETKALIKKIPLLVPKVPQQRDDKKCGNYILYYIDLFLSSAPETFSISEGYPYFMKEDWFTAEGFESFCKTLDSTDQQSDGSK